MAHRGVVSVLSGQGGGVPLHIVVDGVTYTRLISRVTGKILMSRDGRPLYGRAA